MSQQNQFSAIEWAYAKGFAGTLLVLLFSYGIAFLFNHYWPLHQSTIDAIELGGLVFDGTALYGIVSAHVRSLSGLLSQEKVNHTFLVTCVTIGLLCYFVSHFLKAAGV